jgi:hypothetical protein
VATHTLKPFEMCTHHATRLPEPRTRAHMNAEHVCTRWQFSLKFLYSGTECACGGGVGESHSRGPFACLCLALCGMSFSFGWFRLFSPLTRDASLWHPHQETLVICNKLQYLLTINIHIHTYTDTCTCKHANIRMQALCTLPAVPNE